MTQLALENIPLTQLHFDPDNPRLPDRLKGQTDDVVLEYFLHECNLIELMMSIGEKGYFAGEPLMIVPRAEGGYIVVEGNRRLAALKLLQPDTPVPVMAGQVQQARNSANHTPTDIPSLQFDLRENILTYLGYRHITGIKEWDALAKARYLKQLRLQYGPDHTEAHRALAREIGSKSATVAKLLTGYALLEKARDLGILRKLKIEMDDIPFSLLTTGIGWEGISNFIGLKSAADVEAAGLKEDEFTEFFTWVFDKTQRSHTVLGESRNFPKLSRVVANEAALASLRRGDPLDTADLLTSGPLEAVRKHLFLAETSIRSAQESSSLADGLTNDDVTHSDRIRKAASSLHASLKGLVEAMDGLDAEA